MQAVALHHRETLTAMPMTGVAPISSAAVSVSNTGGRAGDEVVLLFAAPPGAGTQGRPLQFLVGFERLHLAAGEAQTVEFELLPRHFTLAAERGGVETPAGEWLFWVGHGGKEKATRVTVQ